MQWIEKMNAAMDYIEANLCGRVDAAEAARIACCSAFHFQRMFSYIAGVPLAEYVRRRRMTLAAADLQAGARVTEVAARYGYDSPTAFNRAFQSVNGVAPTRAREGCTLTAYAPMRFSLTVSGGMPLLYRLEKRDVFRVVGLGAPMSAVIEENFQTVPDLWAKVAETQAIPRLLGIMNGEPQGVLGVSACYGDAWRYLICVSSDREVPEGFEACEVPACTWAVFAGRGPMPQAVQELEKRAVLEWLPGSGYEYANAPDIEVYLNAEPQNAAFEVWLPVVKA